MPELGLFSPFICGEKKMCFWLIPIEKCSAQHIFDIHEMFRIVIESVWGGASGPTPTLLMPCSSLFLATGLGLFVNGGRMCESREPWCSPGASACVVFSGVLLVYLQACGVALVKTSVCDSSQCTKGNDFPLRVHVFAFFLFALGFYSCTVCVGGIWEQGIAQRTWR